MGKTAQYLAMHTAAYIHPSVYAKEKKWEGTYGSDANEHGLVYQLRLREERQSEVDEDEILR